MGVRIELGKGGQALLENGKNRNQCVSLVHREVEQLAHYFGYEDIQQFIHTNL